MALFGARDGSQSASPREHQPLRVGEAAASLR
jgi:hypothetical protein